MFLSHVCGPSQQHCFILFHALKFNPYTPTNGQINFNCEAKIMFGSSNLTFSIRDILRPSWSWLYGSWIYNCLCNEYLSTLTLWVRIPFMTRCTRYNIMWWSVSVTYPGRCFFLGTLVSSNNKTDRHDITEIFLKVALNTITLTLTKHFIFLIIDKSKINTLPVIKNAIRNR